MRENRLDLTVCLSSRLLHRWPDPQRRPSWSHRRAEIPNRRKINKEALKSAKEERKRIYLVGTGGGGRRRWGIGNRSFRPSKQICGWSVWLPDRSGSLHIADYCPARPINQPLLAITHSSLPLHSSKSPNKTKHKKWQQKKWKGGPCLFLGAQGRYVNPQHTNDDDDLPISKILFVCSMVGRTHQKVNLFIYIYI